MKNLVSRPRVVLAVFLIAVAAIASTAAADAADDRAWVAQFCNGVARTVYGLAWPSATYGHWEYRGMSYAGGEVDLTIRLFGKSYFDGSDLWTDVTFDIRRDGLHDLWWGDNNALLMAPGETASAVAGAIIELDRAYQRSQDTR